MELVVQSSKTLEALSEVIFDEKWDVDPMHRLYVQTWLVRSGVAAAQEPERVLRELLDYARTGTPSPYLQQLGSLNPYFLDWFGKPLVGDSSVLSLLSELIGMAPYAVEVPAFLDGVDRYLQPLGLPDRLQSIVGEPYPLPDAPLRYVVSEHTTHAYNVYPDTIVHFRKENPKWYVAGFGHEAGHLLTWDMCSSPEVRPLLQNDTTRGFSELIATLLNKLLLDAYGICCDEVFVEIQGWESYLYEKNPGKPLFDAMMSEIEVGSYSSLREECLRLLRLFQ